MDLRNLKMDLRSENEDDKIFENFVNCMEKCIDPDIDPCVDFLGYSCGKFREENYDVSRGEFPPRNPFNLYEKLLKNETIDGSLIRKVRDFYNSYPRDIKRLLQDENIVTFCGGFPAFHDNWTSENFDWIKAAAILSTLAMDTIISIVCGFCEYLDNKRIINVWPIELVGDLKNAEEILKKFGIEEEKIRDIIYDVNLIKEKIDMATLQKNNDNEPDMVIKTFEEVKKEEFDYQKFYENLLKQPLKDDDIFHLHNKEPGHLERFLHIFAEASPKTVANYMTFMVLCSVESDLEHPDLKLVESYFTPVFLSVGFAKYGSEYEQEKLLYVPNRLKDVAERFNKETGINVDGFLHSNSSFSNKDVLEYINVYFNTDKIEKEFADLEISPTNIFQNITNLAKHGPPESVRKCLSHKSEDILIYLETRDTLETLMHHYNKPLLHHFSDPGLLFRIGHLFPQPLQESIEAYKLVEECIKEQIKTFNFPEEIFEPGYNHWIEDVVLSIEKIKLAYEDYTLWLTENENKAKMQDEILKRLNLNSRKAFFVSVLQHYCGDDYKNLLEPFIAILNLEEFAKEFECKLGSRMNPENKCLIKWNKA